MNKIYLLPLVTFLIGLVVTIIGALLKIMHWPFANILLTIGLLTKAVSIILLIIALIKNSK